jgi:hypothetical protein
MSKEKKWRDQVAVGKAPLFLFLVLKMSFAGQVAIITGGAQGIGFGIAE